LSLVGIGIDIVAVARIVDLMDRHGPRFLERCFRRQEMPATLVGTSAAVRPDPSWVAGRWAAKEAFLKALGQDVRPIPYREIEVPPLPSGSGGLMLHGRAREALNRVDGRRIHLTISHDDHIALASVLIEK
jgi:holo-[acyl-carrier protein] synthase